LVNKADTAVWGNGSIAPLILNLILDGSELSAWRPGRCKPHNRSGCYALSKVNIVFTDVSKERSGFINTAVWTAYLAECNL